MIRFGGTELICIIVLMFAIILFLGPSRIGTIAGTTVRAFRDFKEGLMGDQQGKEKNDSTESQRRKVTTRNKDNEKIINTARLEVRGKTLVFDNTIIQIPNISMIEIGELKTQFPHYVWLILIVGGGIYYSYLDTTWFAIIVLGIVGKIIYDWYAHHEFGLIIRLNSGLAELIQSPNAEFLKEVALILKNIMDNEEEKSITFNLDKRTIIDNVSGSTVVLGNATGDIVNRV
jgi:Sec-independent protein translocase protein TatA